MTISYSLGANPKWYIADLVGRPLGGGSMETYRSLDKSQKKFVFQDPGGNFPWPDPLLFDENGSQGPIYWEIDSGDPTETYYIEVYDANGVLQWTQDNYLPGGSGGGGSVTTAVNLQNFVPNNIYWRNIGATANPISTLVTTLAPGTHAGLTTTASNAIPDIVFLKNNLSATDNITFPAFLLGTQPLNGDVAPQNYMNYTCGVAGSSETQKCVQIPITKGVQNFTNQPVCVTIWARGNSPSSGNTLLLQWRDFYGDGVGASSDDLNTIASITLSTSWQQYVVTTTVPDVSGKTLGGCGNDGLFLQIQFPLSVTCNIDHCKPSFYLGSLSPVADFSTPQEVDGLLNVPRSGFTQAILNTSASLGWVLMNDGTIGNALSNATTRANIDTFPLFNVIWTNVSNANAQLYNSAGDPIDRGSSSSADFVANNQIALTKSLGRALSNIGMPSSGGSGTNWMIGQISGEELHTPTEAEMFAHNHPGSSQNKDLIGQ